MDVAAWMLASVDVTVKTLRMQMKTTSLMRKCDVRFGSGVLSRVE